MLDEELGEKILYRSSLFVAERCQTLTQCFDNFRPLLKLKQTLVAFSILNYYRRLAVDSQHHRRFCLFHLTHHFAMLLSRLKVDKLIMSRASFMVTPSVDKFALNFTNREIL